MDAWHPVKRGAAKAAQIHVLEAAVPARKAVPTDASRAQPMIAAHAVGNVP